MKIFFKNKYKTTFFISIILISIMFVLYLAKYLTFKEYIAILFGISGITTICYLVLMYENNIKRYNEVLELKNQLIKDLSEGLINGLTINNYLSGMCHKAYELIVHDGWKKEWIEFVMSIEKQRNRVIKNINPKTNIITDHLKTKIDDNINNNPLNLENLKKNLKRFEMEENYEKCQILLRKIKEIEK